MRQVFYGGAMSLDGYIAGPNGEHDWIVMDPEMDFAEMMARYDTFLVGRKTFEMMQHMGGGPPTPGIRSIICSRTLDPRAHPEATLSTDAVATVRELRASPGRDIAVFGGGELFRSLLAAGEVDRVEAAVIPVLLGGGTPFLPSPAERTTLELVSHRVYKKTGVVRLEYAVVRR